MKFSFVITNLAGGGAERVLLTLSSELLRQGVDVEIILLENRIEHDVPDGIKVTILMEKLRRSPIGKRVMARRLRKYMGTQEGPDYIISALPFANEVCYLAHMPNHWCRVDTTLGMVIKKLSTNNPAKARRQLRRYRRIYNNRPLIAVSNGVADDIKKLGITSHVVTISNPFNFDDIRSKADEYVVEEKDYIVHVGRFQNEKRHDVLINAWRHAGIEQKLLLLGNYATPEGESTRQLVIDLGLEGRVVFMGFKPNPYPYIKNAKALILSSDHEGLPTVLIEALILRVPVVSTDCPSGPSEILTGELGRFLSPVGDVEALSENIRKVIARPPQISEHHAEKFDATVCAKKYLALCE